MAHVPKMTPVRSSAISEFHYDAATHALFVRFTSGKLYVARDVTLERAETFAGSLSKGRYFNDQIRGNHIIDEVME